MSRMGKSSLVAVAFLVTTSPAWAGPCKSTGCCWKVYCEGVNRHGCLTHSGGEGATFYGWLNSKTGCYIGKACGSVENSTRLGSLTYFRKNFFCDQRWRIGVNASIYTVRRTGKCTYVA